MVRKVDEAILLCRFFAQEVENAAHKVLALVSLVDRLERECHDKCAIIGPFIPYRSNLIVCRVTHRNEGVAAKGRDAAG